MESPSGWRSAKEGLKGPGAAFINWLGRSSGASVLYWLPWMGCYGNK